MMSLFMFYTASLYALQFFIVGAMFASIYAFYDQVFGTVFSGSYKLE